MTPIILLAEDDRVVSYLVGAILERQGFEVEHATDVEATVLRACRAPAPDLILLDMHFPDGTAHDVVRRLADCNAPSAPIVLLTGATAAMLGELPPNVRAVLNKPVRPAELLEVVGRFVPQPPPTVTAE